MAEARKICIFPSKAAGAKIAALLWRGDGMLGYEEDGVLAGGGITLLFHLLWLGSCFIFSSIIPLTLLLHHHFLLLLSPLPPLQPVSLKPRWSQNFCGSETAGALNSRTASRFQPPPHHSKKSNTLSLSRILRIWKNQFYQQAFVVLVFCLIVPRETLLS